MKQREDYEDKERQSGAPDPDLDWLEKTGDL